ncbi:ABC transporter permease [Corynebacterium hindlerae]|uniref:ABC transporter permease n=1 Tax=Corynebacterium hindlerae TaxID=699041 RepID=A0A7G5FFG3_9CORY|nr:ABC transporter permease [Corynebacterium hindlerae]QMV85354.1 ABC transporter permease [Corynebacterium hindlerae]
MTKNHTFSDGTFTPDPRHASVPVMIAAQARIEATLFLRHGEQQLLSLIIPAALLIGLSLTDVLGLDSPVHTVFPFTLAIAGMSVGFTGQAIAVAFDRRYGALKRIGASGVPSWTIILGKVVAVVGVSIVQTLILGAIALAIGWTMPLSGILPAAVVMLFGVGTFTAVGLLLGGTCSSEVVLAVANTLWFLLLGSAAYFVLRASGPIPTAALIIPSVSFADALQQALTGSIAWLNLLLLSFWAIAGMAAATKLFRFS